MKLFSLIILICFTLSAFCQSTKSSSLEPNICDSMLIQELRNHIDDILVDTLIDHIDSSVWEVIDGVRYYKKTFSFSSIGEHDFLLLIDFNNVKCAFKSYAYIFDYFFEIGLDLNYDYYSIGNHYIRGRNKEYEDRMKLLRFYFNTYSRYNDLTINLEEEDRQSMITSMVDFGDLRYPLQTMQILNERPPLNKDLFWQEMYKASNRDK